MPPSLDPTEAALRTHALAYPETTEAFPWGHRTIKVRDKAFVFIGIDRGELGLSVKLPHSGAAALTLPFTEPTHYGLGKSGWVSARFPKGQRPPLDILRAWIDESYRAIAPKRLVAQLGSGTPVTATRTAKRLAAKRPAMKRTARKQAKASRK